MIALENADAIAMLLRQLECGLREVHEQPCRRSECPAGGLLRFKPSGASWPNAVETVFSCLTRSRIRCGVFRCLVELQAVLDRWVAELNENPKPSSGPNPPRPSSKSLIAVLHQL
jgi:hypothetical protein